MSIFQVVYSDLQRDAIAHAVLDLKVRPHRRVAELAAAGLLELDGVQVPAFTIPDRSVGDIARKAERRRAGTLRGGVTDVPHRDSVEAIRQRLGALLDTELTRCERQHVQGRKVDGEEIRKLARAAREYAHLPDRTDPTPGTAPGDAKTPSGKQEDPRNRSALAAGLLADARGNGSAQPEATPHTTPTERTPHDTDSSNAGATTHHDNTHHNDENHHAPSSRVGEVLAWGDGAAAHISACSGVTT